VKGIQWGRTMLPEIKYPDIHVQLTGVDGNARAIMGTVSEALRKAGVSACQITRFRVACMEGDYNDLLRTCMTWVDVS
jgi:hypothetical protein